MRLSLAICCLCFSSCAFTAHEVRLSYPPASFLGTQLTETSFQEPLPIALNEFEDLRRNPSLIGEKRNAWMMHTGQVHATESVASWLRDALALELEDAHFAITVPEKTGTPPLVLHGEIVRVLSSRQYATDAVVEFSVKLKRGFKIIWTRRYRGAASLTAEDLESLEQRLDDDLDPWGEALARALAMAAAPLAQDLQMALRDD